MKFKFPGCILIAVLWQIGFFSFAGNKTIIPERIILKDNWHVQSSEKTGLSGETLSLHGADMTGWYNATVPSTVMGVLTRNGLYPDLFVGENYKQVDIKSFEVPWWFCREFELPANRSGNHVILHFDGVGYAADIWLNGSKIASKDTTYGPYRRYAIDITHLAGKRNNLAVEVYRAQAGDFNLGFVDWNPRPPDENMGIWREVYLEVTGKVMLANTWVRSVLNCETFQDAALIISTDIKNLSVKNFTGYIRGNMEGISFRYPVDLNAGESRSITLSSLEIPELFISHPRVWWCNTLGSPELYHLKLEIEDSETVSAISEVTFGIRDIRMYTTAEGYKGFRLNGRDILIRGAGWTDDIFLRDSAESLEMQVRYVKDMNLNTLRFESIWGNTQAIYDLCDRYGILAMVGWSCQWEWDEYLGKACDDFGGIRTEADMKLALQSLKDQVFWLRNHPGIFVWLVGSDKCPRPELEKRYAALLKTYDDRPYLASAGTRISEVSGPTGVKMNGPYEYVAPVYWYTDTINGGAFGFNTETGPGPQMAVEESVRRMIPENRLFPPNDTWNYHCTHSIQAFNKLDVFNHALSARYGEAADLKDYLLKSEIQGYEALGAMFEAFRSRIPKTTGIIQWMLNSAWPSLYWHLYDYYLIPSSAYYAAKKANQPLQLVYDYGNGDIYAINESPKDAIGYAAGIISLDNRSNVLYNQRITLDIPSGRSVKIAHAKDRPAASFLSLNMMDETGQTVARNFYWLGKNKDELDWDKTYWAYTPMKAYSDFRYLDSLPKTKLLAQCRQIAQESIIEYHIQLHNPSSTLAFFLKLELLDQEGIMVKPVIWEDNYFSLLPGESRTVPCRVDNSLLQKVLPHFRLSGWNVDEMVINLNDN
jgi:exo-1,4-beta-D-glucosaminidase